MTIKEALKSSINLLKESNIEAPAVDAGVILCHILKCDRAYLYTHSDRPLTESQVKSFFESVRKRASGMPVSYITGQREFMSLNFIVTPHALIPRPETEILVETVLGYVKKVKSYNKKACDKIRILDIGTGSGCIAVSLAYYIENCKVTAVDISDEALKLAKQNAVNNRVENKIAFLKSNLFSEIDNIKLDCLYDVIVSNPPYIPKKEIESLQEEVKRYEPFIALDGGNDGLDFYRRIIKDAPSYLKQNGFLALEIGYGQAEAVTQLMNKSFCSVQVIKDLSDIDRVVTGKGLKVLR